MFKTDLRRQLEKVFPDHELTRWFDPLSLSLDEDDSVLRVSFPHSFFASWFMASLKQDFERHSRDISSQRLQIVYNTPLRQVVPASANEPVAAGWEHPKVDAAPLRDMLNPVYTFTSFLVNRKNDFPYAAALKAVEEIDCPSFTPIVFYGKSGCGKTHLLAAMANAMRENGRACYYGSLEFMRVIRKDTRHISEMPFQAVVMDDVQHICGDQNAQDRLCQLMDIFKAGKRLLVLSFDGPPASFPGMDQRLRFRLESSLVMEIKRPDLEIRRQYVQREIDRMEIALSKQQVLALAQKCLDIRSIAGALTRLQAFKELAGTKSGPTEAFSPDVSEILTKTIGVHTVTTKDILNTVATHFSVSPEEMLGKKRQETVTLARQIAMLLCRELTNLSLPRIGRFFGGRDHTSILYSIKKIKKLQASNKDMHNKVEQLRAMCLMRSS